jgi:hypothetical protein
MDEGRSEKARAGSNMALPSSMCPTSCESAWSLALRSADLCFVISFFFISRWLLDE